MKEQDYSVILTAAQNVIANEYSELNEVWPNGCAALLIAHVYMMNDLTTGFGQDVTLTGLTDERGKPLRASLISSRDLISVILPEGASHYRADDVLCGYEDLEADIQNICMITQAVVDRIYSRM